MTHQRRKFARSNDKLLCRRLREGVDTCGFSHSMSPPNRVNFLIFHLFAASRSNNAECVPNILSYSVWHDGQRLRFSFP
jgi:hypothetical protein